MGNNRPVKVKDWERFLTAHECKFVRHASGSHEHWKCPNCLRTITHRSQEKDVPALHLKTNLTTMKLTLEYLYDWLEKN